MTIRRLFVFLLMMQLVSIGVRDTLDPDMWWHLRTGEFIWQHGIPRHDIFSFTVPNHDWITHEWLSDALMWGIYTLGGLRALSVVFAGLSGLAFWLLYECSAGRPYLSAIIVVLAAAAAAPSFGVRPQIFSILMAAVFVSILERFKERRLGRGALLYLPLLTTVWANLHGGYLLAIALLATYVGGGALDSLVDQPSDGRLSRADLQLLAIVAVVCLGTAVVNPNGWRLWSFPFGTLSSVVIQENIAEWRSPDFHSYIYWPFAAMIGIGLASWLLARHRLSWIDVLLFVGTAAAGLVSVRHIALFAVVATLPIARSLASSIQGTRIHSVLTAQNDLAPFSRGTARLNWAILLVGILATGYWDAARLARNDAAVARVYPVQAVDFLQREGLIRERGYNTYVWGGYLIWRGVPVFIDGRAEVYDDFLSYYLKTFRLTDEWRRPLDEFHVRYVLVERSNPLATLLAASGEWREGYADSVARVFLRVGSDSG